MLDKGGQDGQQGVGELAALVQLEKAPGQWGKCHYWQCHYWHQSSVTSLVSLSASYRVKD